MSPAEQFAQSLIGQQGSRWRLPTPALVVDLDRLEANITRQAARAKAAGLALRPHAKTHKSAFVARAQIAAGAVGVCCAKPGEAEALAAAGVTGLLITSPIASTDVADRCAALTRLDPGLMVVVDNPIGAKALQTACAAQDTNVGVLIDVDVGMGRTGVAGVEAAVALADEIARSPRLRFVGVQGYGGAWQHMEGADRRLAAVQTGMARLSAVIEALREQATPAPWSPVAAPARFRRTWPPAFSTSCSAAPMSSWTTSTPTPWARTTTAPSRLPCSSSPE